MAREQTLNEKTEQVVAGLKKPLQALRELLQWPFLYTKEAAILGLQWPRGLLLYGPPGTGKTSLVHAMVRESGAHLISISAGSVHRAYAGESERLLREAFAEASAKASTGMPVVIFIDEIDVLCPPRDSRRQHESRLVAQLLTLMDDKRLYSSQSRAVVVAATNRINSIDPALRRPGRFDREIEVTAPNGQERYEILKLHASRLPLDVGVELRLVSDMCNGYVGADLAALCREAAMASLRRSLQDPSHCNMQQTLTMQDWEQAHSKVGPSIVRGAVADVPKVLWDDIGGLTEVKRKLQQTVEWPIQHADALARLGLKPVRGVLLYGPPGCSKTTLVKAAAHAAKANLFSLSGAELYSMFVGEGEALLRETFRRARLVAPSIVFFDEADAIAAKREGGDQQSTGTGNSVGEKLLSTLLTEIDGLELAQGVLVLGATNRPRSIDGALMRPGRFDQVLYVPPPDQEGRLEVLKVHTRNMRLANNVDLSSIALATDRFTGAELAGLCSEAGMAALRENLSADTVYERHFLNALEGIRPSLTTAEIASYAKFGLSRHAT
ncbi:hypothetical protein GOP47_0017746 [Adiantum capillus-veneris]|uniref:AAA+ ATPase domain-containing protein n=1 Tax=Adiantum capillus-veneris TaxID=13818 RepID=A0A9D4UGU1_ADICA|nr:hypothetical protein GOP47_0017746 [Adiantum capillus-veneris]